MVQKIKDKEYLYFKGEKIPIAYQGRMMEAVEWLLPFTWITGQTLQYSRETERSLRNWLEKEPKQEEVVELFVALSRVQKDMEQYLMDWDKLIWDADWVCWNAQNKSLKMVYCPWDMPAASTTNFLVKLAQLFWIKAIHQRWKNQALILMVFDMNMAAVQNEIPVKWVTQNREEEIERNKSKSHQNALEILMEKELKKKSLWKLCKEKFPFALR